MDSSSLSSSHAIQHFAAYLTSKRARQVIFTTIIWKSICTETRDWFSRRCQPSVNQCRKSQTVREHLEIESGKPNVALITAVKDIPRFMAETIITPRMNNLPGGILPSASYSYTCSCLTSRQIQRARPEFWIKANAFCYFADYALRSWLNFTETRGDRGGGSLKLSRTLSAEYCHVLTDLIDYILFPGKWKHINANFFTPNRCGLEPGYITKFVSNNDSITIIVVL